MSGMTDREMLDEHCQRTMSRVERFLSHQAVPEVHEHSEPVQAFFMQLPLPAWLKKTDGSIYLSNPAFRRVYAPNQEPNVNWSKAEAEVFDDTDMAALQQGSAFAVESGSHPSDGLPVRVLVFKYRMDVQTEEGAETMVAGIAVTHWSREWFGGRQERTFGNGDREAAADGAGGGPPGRG